MHDYREKDVEKPIVEISQGKFRFVNGSTRNLKARMAMVSTNGPDPTNTKPFGDESTVLTPSDEADAGEPGIPKDMTVWVYFQDQATNQWYQGSHANNNDAIGGAFVLFGGGSVSETAEIMLGVNGGGTMISGMPFAPIPSTSNGGNPPGWPPSS